MLWPQMIGSEHQGEGGEPGKGGEPGEGPLKRRAACMVDEVMKKTKKEEARQD